MKLLSRSLILALTTIACSATTGLAQSTWKTYTDRTGGYSISMPGQPQDLPGSQYALPSGDTLVYQGKGFLMENQQGIKVMYGVAYTDLPVAFRKDSKAAQQALAAITCENSSFRDARQLVSQQTFRLNGFPGREIKCQGEEVAVAKIRAFLVGERLYMLLAATNHEPGAAKSIDGFIKSFKIR
jgi:hypothetical protein